MQPASSKVSHAVKTIVISILVGGAGALLAFGPRAGEELPKDRVVVDYWEHWTGDEEAGMRAIVNDFNNTVGHEKNIYVRYLSTSDIEKKTLIAAAAGVPPDIAGLYDQNIPQFGAQNALQPLDELAAAHGIRSDSYKKVFWDECHYDGHLYGLVSSAFDLALYYNTEIFHQRADALRARGLDPDRAPRTIAELDAYAQAIEQVDSDGHILVAGYLPLEPGWYQKYTCIWFRGSWWDKQTQRFTLTDPGVIRTYAWIQSYSKRLGAEAEVGFRGGLGNFDSPQNGFLSGHVAMEVQGTFLANFIQKQKPSMAGNWAAAPFPSEDPNLKDVTYCNCDVLVIPRLAKHKAEAFEFIAFVNRQDEMEKLARSHCKISPLAKVSSDFLDHHPNPYIRVFDSLAASPNAHPTEPVPILAEVNDEMNVLAQRVSMLQSTPQQALSEMQQRLQAKYDDFVDEQRERGAKTVSPVARQVRDSMKGWAFLSPWLIGFVAFTLVPIGMSFYYSFCRFSLLRPPLLKGTENYRTLLHDDVFWKAVTNTAIYSVVAIPLGMLAALSVAMLLNSKVRGVSLYRTIVFLPSLVPQVASGIIWLWIFNPDLGLLNSALRTIGIRNPPSWLNDVHWAMPALILMSFWGIGNTVVIYLAGLQDVPRELYEASDIDGASPLRKIWHVTLPSISPVIFFNMIMAIIGTLQMFATPYILNQGGAGPDRSTYFFTMYLYDNAFSYLKMGYASSMAWIQFLAVLALTGIAALTSRRWVHYQGK